MSLDLSEDGDIATRKRRDPTGISWASHTFNPWIGCARVSPLCDHCYAAAMTKHRGWPAEWGEVGQGEGTRSRTSDGNWRKPAIWDREAKPGERPLIFCSSLADTFDNHPAVTPWRADLFQVIRDTPRLDWLLLTKRPSNISKLIGREGLTLPENVYLGASVGLQREADQTIPTMSRTKAALRPKGVFLSMEPLLEAVNIMDQPGADDLDWIIVGGETGHHSRWMDLRWARNIRNQCRMINAIFHFKQTGDAAPTTSRLKKQPNLHTLDGETIQPGPTGQCVPNK